MDENEDALFKKALKFLYKRRLEEIGFQANITVRKKEPLQREEPDHNKDGEPWAS